MTLLPVCPKHLANDLTTGKMVETFRFTRYILSWSNARVVRRADAHLARLTFHILTSSSARLTLGPTLISSAHCSFERLMPFAPGSFLPSFS